METVVLSAHAIHEIRSRWRNRRNGAPRPFHSTEAIYGLRDSNPAAYAQRARWLLGSLIQANDEIVADLIANPAIRAAAGGEFNRVIDYLQPPNLAVLGPAQLNAAVINAGVDIATPGPPPVITADEQQKAQGWYEDRTANLTFRLFNGLASITDKMAQKKLDMEKVDEGLKALKKLYRRELLELAALPQTDIPTSYADMADKILSRVSALMYEPDPATGRGAAQV